MEGPMEVFGLPPSNEEECVDFCYAIPTGEVAEGRMPVWKCQEQEGNEVMA